MVKLKNSLLDIFGIFQLVKEPTHALALVISEGVDISSVDVKDLTLSDHLYVFFD